MHIFYEGRVTLFPILSIVNKISADKNERNENTKHNN